MGEVAVQPTPMQQVCERLASPEFGQKLEQALPPSISLDRFTRVTLTAVQQNPELITADKATLFSSVIRCAQDGLLPDGREAAFVIFNQKGKKLAQYMPMIGGYRKIAANHGITLSADVICQLDTFEWSKAPPMVKHTYRLGEDRGPFIGAYAVAYYREGNIVCAPAVMSVDEIEKVRAVSRAATSEYGPWVKWWERMAVKTVARRLFSELPLGDMDERSGRIREQGDVDADLPQIEPKMTVEQANIDAAIVAQVPQDDSTPDDTYEPSDDDWREATPVEDGETLFPIPETARPK